MPRPQTDLLADVIGEETPKRRPGRPRKVIGTNPRAKAKKEAAESSQPDPIEEPIPQLDTPPRRFIGDVEIPPCPEELRDIALGDRTPAVVKWYQENHPEAAKALYRGREVIPGI